MNAYVGENVITALFFKVNTVSVCAEIKYINKVLLLSYIEPVPDSSPYITGLINVGGESIPVIDLTIRLGLKRFDMYTLETPILLCEKDGHQFGVIVDKIIDLVEIGEQDLQMYNEFSQPHSFFVSSVKIQDDIALLINMDKVLDIELVCVA